MDKYDSITNRHIGKLLGRLEPLKIAEIAQGEIKRQMHFLKEDLVSEIKVSGVSVDEHYNK